MSKNRMTKKEMRKDLKDLRRLFVLACLSIELVRDATVTGSVPKLDDPLRQPAIRGLRIDFADLHKRFLRPRLTANLKDMMMYAVKNLLGDVFEGARAYAKATNQWERWRKTKNPLFHFVRLLRNALKHDYTYEWNPKAPLGANRWTPSTPVGSKTTYCFTQKDNGRRVKFGDFGNLPGALQLFEDFGSYALQTLN